MRSCEEWRGNCRSHTSKKRDRSRLKEGCTQGIDFSDGRAGMIYNSWGEHGNTTRTRVQKVALAYNTEERQHALGASDVRMTH